MKKVSCVLLFVLIATVILFVPGCSRVSAVPKSKIAGTYLLTRYEKSSSTPEEPANILETKNIVCFLVVAENGNGYYVYKDNDTAPYVLQAKIGFVPSEDDQDKFEYITYETERDSSPEKIGYDRGTLNKSKPVFKGNLFEGTLTVDYTLYTEFKKVDKAQNLSYVKKRLPDAAVYEYGAFTLNGYFNKNFIEYPKLLIDYEQADIYAYYFVKLDSIAHKATLFYMLKSDMVRKTETVDYNLSIDVDEYNNEAIKLTIGNKNALIAIKNLKQKNFMISYSIRLEDNVYYAKINLIYNEEINDGNIDQHIDIAVSDYQ